MDGVLIINKPSGCTSHDVVEIVRRRFGMRRVGHAGTLDPLAQGVLVLLLGRATRLAEFLTGHQKEYVAGLLLGITTETQDVEGGIVSDQSAAGVTEEDLQVAAEKFRGPIQQIPPMYSAVKIGGQTLHRLARAGKTVERPPRNITVFDLRVSDFQPGEHARATLSCVVSSGTYIRTLCADIGESLGVGGCMEHLLRTSSGPFRIEQCTALEVIERASKADLEDLLLPPADALHGIPRVDVDSTLARQFCHGIFVPGTPSESDGLVRVHGDQGELLGVGRFDAESSKIKPLKVICDTGS